LNLKLLSKKQKMMLLLFHYDVWQESGEKLKLSDFSMSVEILKSNKIMLEEMKEYLEHLIEKIEFIEKDIDLLKFRT